MSGRTIDETQSECSAFEANQSEIDMMFYFCLSPIYEAKHQEINHMANACLRSAAALHLCVLVYSGIADLSIFLDSYGAHWQWLKPFNCIRTLFSIGFSLR